MTTSTGYHTETDLMKYFSVKRNGSSDNETDCVLTNLFLSDNANCSDAYTFNGVELVNGGDISLR